jgi:hypothetical protein
MIGSALKLLAGSIVVFATAHAVRLWLVPDVPAISIGQDSPPLWVLETAFLLRATENVAAIVAVLVVITLVIALIRRALVAR